jgi:hypothetical protein
MMDAKLVREYRENYEAVAAIELEEQRSASMELRWRQLNSLIRMAIDLGLPLRSDEDESVVWERWNQLKARQP